MKRLLAPLLLVGLLCARSAFADGSDDFAALQQKLNDSILDLYAGEKIAPETLPLATLPALAPRLESAGARRLVAEFQQQANRSPAQQIGAARGLLQHLAALEMLHRQHVGRVDDTRAWRSFIALPKYANAVDGALLLQQPDIKPAAISKVLAREYMSWQVMRTRQLFDYLETQVANEEATPEFFAAYSSEIVALANFPAELWQAAELPFDPGTSVAQPPVLSEPLLSDANQAAIVGWRQRVESNLPNLLEPADVVRLERLLARFVKLVPKEYRNGVSDGHINIMLEYREAKQFTEQAQALTNELAPVWRRDRAEAFGRYYGAIHEKLGELSLQIRKLAPVDKVEETGRAASNLLEDKFGLSARRAGSKGNVIEETALEVRTALVDSLAAARADQWDEAESLRLDAYTSFDSEIEVRVLPRNPELGRRTERSFLEGSPGEPGIKTLLDRRAPIEELSEGYERTLAQLDQSVNLLKVSVSPATLAYTAFSIMAREGLEAVVVLAALMAGLRGVENRRTRRLVSSGAWIGVGVSLLTFWLSRTLISSLSRYGEKLEAVISILAVIILFMVTNWVFHKYYWTGWNAKIRSLTKASQQSVSERWEWLALLGVGFLTVYREGFETTLFTQSLLLEGSAWPVVSGLLAGAGLIALMGVAIFYFGAKLPYRKMLIVTGVLVISIMVSFIGSGVRLFQTVGWLPIHPIESLYFPSWVGLWFGLYPSWEGILIPPLGLAYVIGAWLWVKVHAKLAGSAAPAPVAPPKPPEPPTTVKAADAVTA
ncbi:MAG TPA: FTR1 family protein [Chthoniobacteraceae bacterium]|nr:FTR1 family protein [Chthoniobacteraceae bacterium]